jgi:hypothetical protein
MKRQLLAFLVVVTPLAASAAETAYTALRVVGKKDRETLNRVVEVRGRNGMPQPEVWKITVDEPSARGGLREFEVQRGRIIAQRTPTSRSFGGAMNFNQLNLDSDGVFTVVEKEAKDEGIVFSRLEYLLKAGTGGGAPVWQVELFDGKRATGRMVIAADSGAILDRGMTPLPPEPDQRSTDRSGDGGPRYDAGPDEGTYPPPVSDGRWSQRGEKFRSVEDFFHRLGQRFERRGVQLKKFFAGDEPR